MANEQHLDIIKKGVTNWNEWRKNNPDIKPDLCKADLSKANLRGAYLGEADLYEADLHEADLR